MIDRRAIAYGALAAFGVFAAWVLFFFLPHHYAGRGQAKSAGAAPAAQTPQTAQPQSGERKISATLFFVSQDGMSLVQVPRDVPYGATPTDQARAILEAQMSAAPPLLSAIPPDAKLRHVFLTDKGDAFVDFSGELAAKHTGGSLDEILTVYTIVNALTANLPAITRVQILIDGKEVDTLAGHVDLRHPLAKSLEWVAHDTH
jgi:spore germination protein GerM